MTVWSQLQVFDESDLQCEFKEYSFILPAAPFFIYHHLLDRNKTETLYEGGIEPRGTLKLKVEA